jgi:hypothetical protein
MKGNEDPYKQSNKQCGTAQKCGGPGAILALRLGIQERFLRFG